MQDTDPIVASLIRLCEREGGSDAVADEAGVSKANLLQILKGYKLPSNKPRGVGPTLRRKITAAFPDWLNQLSSTDVAVHKVKEPAPVYGIPTTEAGMCKILCDMFAKLPDDADLRFDVLQQCVAIIKKARESPKSHQDVSEFPGRKPSAA